MTSATLFREGDDLDELLAELDARHPGQVRVVSVSYPRQGGMFGFFARQRVAVEYTLDFDAAPVAVQAALQAADALDSHPLAALIDAAEAAETRRPARPVESVPPAQRTPAENAEFAKLLLELAARKSAAAADIGEPAPAPIPTLSPAPQPAPTQPAVPETSRAQLTLRRRLAEIGVPIDWVPADSADTYRVVEQLITRLPAAPEPPRGAGDLLVIVGPPATALRAGQTMSARLHLRPDAIWTAGCPGADHQRVITDAWQAATVAAELRLSGHGPAIVVVGLDPEPEESGSERWAGDLVKALAPEALWTVVDATRKPSDTRALLREIGTPTALVVTAAERTASPASVWELGVPTALLDGRPATRGTWAALLIDKLAALES